MNSNSAGIDQTEEMKRFLWDTHFAAVASDMPSLERWPPVEGVPHLHQTLLGCALRLQSSAVFKSDVW